METKTQNPRNLAFLQSEASRTRSFDVVTIASGEGVLNPGTVIGKITATDEYAASPNAEVAGKEGAEVATAIVCYRIDATNAPAAVTVVSCDAEVKKSYLLFAASVDDEAKQAAKLDQLAAVGIKAR